MNHRITNSGREGGSVLMVTLFMSALIGFFLFSYLYLVRTQRTLVARSQAWNAALALAEAGAEEGLAQLNPGAPLPTIDRTANGWGSPSGGFYGPMQRSLSNDTYSVVFTTNTYPIIYSTGYVSVPSIPAIISRAVRISTTNVPLFNVALAASGNIDLKGNNVASDSFNSTDPNLSTNGRYDSSKTSTNGDVASVAGIVNVGNGNINGSVLLGPSASDSIGANGYVTGGVYNDFNYNFPDVVLPQTSWLSASSLLVPLLIDGTFYNYVFTATTGDYLINGLSGNVYVASNSAIRLRLTGDASPGTIRVAGSGSTAGNLTIYMDGPSFSLSGNDTVDGGNAANLTLFGTPNCTSISMSGNAAFTGTIYAPEAALSMSGSGNNDYDFVGACVSKTVTLNGHFNFHFDENLLAHGPIRGYGATSWREL